MLRAGILLWPSSPHSGYITVIGSISGSSGTCTGNAATATRWATGRTIALTGDVTGTSAAFDGSAALSFAATLANSGVAAGTYTKVTVDAKGRVTTGASLASADITGALGYTPANKAGESFTGSISVTGTITATGDITAYADVSLKTEVVTISNALGLVNSLRGVSFMRSHCAAMTELGNAEKQEIGRWANNRVENSHLSLRRRKRAMLGFRRMKTLQKCAAVHANVHNHFNLEHHLIDRQTHKTRRSAALAEWQSLMA